MTTHLGLLMAAARASFERRGRSSPKGQRPSVILCEYLGLVAVADGDSGR